MSPSVARINTVVLAVLLMSDPRRAPAQPSFQGLGSLSQNNFFSNAAALSDDGSTVVGLTLIESELGLFTIGYRWKDGVMISLGDLPGGSFYSEPGGVSADGSFVSGMSLSANGTEAFRWHDGAMLGLGDLPGGPFYSHGFQISGDGSTVVGLSRTDTGDFPFRWKNGVMTNLADDFTGSVTGWGIAASFDGEVVVGFINGQPFRWADSNVDLIDIPPSSLFGQARAVSPDGRFVAGVITHATSPDFVTEAFRWHDGKLLLLGDLPGGHSRSKGDDISADGNVIVGTGRSGTVDLATHWTPFDGMRPVRDILVNDYNLDLTGWTLQSANGVSADGLTIAGSGTNPNGRPEAWIARIACLIQGDFDNNGLLDGRDIPWFVRCLLNGRGCGCGDLTGDLAVTPDDLEPFVDALLTATKDG